MAAGTRRAVVPEAVNTAGTSSSLITLGTARGTLCAFIVCGVQERSFSAILGVDPQGQPFTEGPVEGIRVQSDIGPSKSVVVKLGDPSG